MQIPGQNAHWKNGRSASMCTRASTPLSTICCENAFIRSRTNWFSSTIDPEVSMTKMMSAASLLGEASTPNDWQSSKLWPPLPMPPKPSPAPAPSLPELLSPEVLLEPCWDPPTEQAPTTIKAPSHATPCENFMISSNGGVDPSQLGGTFRSKDVSTTLSSQKFTQGIGSA